MLKKADDSSFARSHEDLPELLSLIKERSFKTGDFTLASGRKSNLYFDMKPTIMSARGNLLSAQVFLNRARELRAEYIGGLEMGAVPIISTVAGLSAQNGAPIGAFFVRKKPKEHGTMLKVEGLGPRESLEGRRVAMADDVTTSGGSVWQAIEVALTAGAIVRDVICLVDREEGAAEFLASKGISLRPIFSAKDFVD
jgi:orotate phosphoribosyltransferase